MVDRQKRVLFFLKDFYFARDAVVVPWSITQEGIARGTGILRSHVSEALKKLVSEGMVRDRIAHVEERERRMRVYFLTEMGMNMVYQLREELKMYTYIDFSDKVPTIKYFFGRSKEAEHFGNWLESMVSKVFIIRGIAGIGKTTFMVKMLNDYKGTKNIFWYRFYEWSSLRNMGMRLSDFLHQMGKPKLRSYLESRELPDILEMLSIIEEDLKDTNTLLIFDDFNKAEEKSIQFFTSLVDVLERIQGIKVVIIGRYIPKFYNPKDVVIKKTIEEMELMGLDRASSLELFKVKKGNLSDFESIFRLTNGHPLSLELMEKPTDITVDSGLARYIQDEILVRLDEKERTILNVASVFRYPVHWSAILSAEDCMRWKIDLNALNKLVSMSLMQVSGEIYDVHDMVREFFYSRLNPGVRRVYHRSAARHYLQEPENLAIIEAQYHLIRAGDVEEAASLVAKYGNMLLSKGYIEEFASILEEYKRIPQERIEDETWCEILKLKGDTNGAMRRYDDALDAYSHSLACCDESDTDRKAELHRKIGIIYWNKGWIDDALNWFDNGLKILGKGRMKVEASRLNGWLGWVHFYKGNLNKSLQYHEKELKIANAIKDLHEIAYANNDLGTNYHCRGNWKDAVRYYMKSLEVRKELNDLKGMASLYNNLGSVYEITGAFNEAIENYERSMEILRETGDHTNIALICCNLGAIYLETGDVEKAIWYFEESTEICRKIGEKYVLAMAYCGLGESYGLTKNVEKALEFCNDSIKLAKLYDYNEVLGSAYCAYGAAHVLRKDFELARRYVQDGIDIFEKLGLQRQLGRAYLTMASILGGEKKNLAEARSYLKKGKEIFEKLGAEAEMGRLRRTRRSLRL